MIGTLQWLVSLGRFDIFSAVVTLSRFRIDPRVGHLERLKRVYGYVRKFQHGEIRIRTQLPDTSKIAPIQQNWDYSVYGKVKEQIPDNAPRPLGKPVITTSYVDANLYHDYITGRALTGVLHYVNGTPISWFSKRQATVETATYGSEFVAARIATEPIIDLRTTLRYMGVPLVKMSHAYVSGDNIDNPSYLFGDNKSVITSATLPQSALNKRHNALAYHRVREAVAAKIINFIHIEGKSNPADILSKHCGFPQAWPLLEPVFFWMGEPNKEKKDEIYRPAVGE